MKQPSLDLVREVLDHEIVDVDGVPCGVVDDVEFTGNAGEPAQAVALLVGPGAWGPRLPPLLAFLVRHTAGSRCVRVPLEAVQKIDERIVLKHSARDARLDTADRRAARWLAWIPGHGKAD